MFKLRGNFSKLELFKCFYLQTQIRLGSLHGLEFSKYLRVGAITQSSIDLSMRLVMFVTTKLGVEIVKQCAGFIQAQIQLKRCSFKKVSSHSFKKFL